MELAALVLYPNFKQRYKSMLYILETTSRDKVGRIFLTDGVAGQHLHQTKLAFLSRLTEIEY